MGEETGANDLLISFDTRIAAPIPSESEESEDYAALEGIAETPNFKEQWLATEMERAQHRFLDWTPITMVLATWNVNNKKPPDEGLDDWLTGTIPSSVVPELFCVGFQEVDLTAAGLLTQENSRIEPWRDQLQAALGRFSARSGPEYKLIAEKQLVGIYFTVFIRGDVFARVRNVSVCTVKTGLRGKMGNKGAVAVSVVLDASRFCFVNAHLAPHRNAVMRRNQDFLDICQKVQFRYPTAHPATAVRSPASSAPTDIFHGHDAIFWIGDLNYRIRNDLSYDEVLRLVHAGNLAELLAHDQLSIEMRAGRAFASFREPAIAFPPTYKFVPGTVSEYTPNEEGKVRVPAWCDRVLWRVCDQGLPEPDVLERLPPVAAGRELRPFGVRVSAYRSFPDFTVSDHKPVAALVEVACKTINQERRSVVFNEVMSRIDRLENSSRPICVLSSHDVELGDVHYARPVTHAVSLTNTGAVAANWKFVGQRGFGGRSFPLWLTATPRSGSLLPQESVDISFTASVSGRYAARLNRDEKALDEVAVIHLNRGRDIFVRVRGVWHRSCFGASLEELCSALEPMRAAPPAARAPVLRIPKELWRIVDLLFATEAYRAPGFLLTRGSADEVHALRECLDRGESFPPLDAFSAAAAHAPDQYSVHSAGELLLMFLRSLTDAVVPSAQYTDALHAASNAAAAHSFLQTLDRYHYASFVYVVSFLREALKFSAKNLLTTREVARIVSEALLRPPSGTGREPKREAAFLLHFLMP
eukprot:gnl/Chilomastix_cuspidata/3488.p2 GENE.gnl/Chilomastix_cuspidata/3488~~gnl/Chilomastix_cuspidata/3488.p2  ORF type:complete len:757 (+),score=297.81 gnl/Chilomastix_cuspidata/3488:3565-5835(+)